MSAVLASNLAWSYYLARRYDDAVAAAEQTVALDPGFWWGQAALGLAYEKKGRFDEAIAALNRARALDRSPTVLEFLAGTYVAAGRTTEARAVLKELTERAKQEYVCPYEVATAHAALGDTRAALAELEKGFAHRADCMLWVETDPKLDALRKMPEFQALRRKMGLTGTQQ
jgi:tetratricopeptide (TPR) repeat protein